jgi:hypothetical protein
MPEPLDSADADALRDLVRSRGYELVANRVADELQRERAQLEGPLDVEKTANVRGAIRALRMVLQVPQILIGEVKASDKE